MATIVHDCPRCKAQRVTFDVRADTYLGTRYDWQSISEIYCVCRHCRTGTIFVVELSEVRLKTKFNERGSISAENCDLADIFAVKKAVGLADVQAMPTPEHLPDEISARFNEGARCLAIGAYNAAGAMFRLCLDLATKVMAEQVPEIKVADSLAKRIRVLIDAGHLGGDLAALAAAVRLDGNDAAHDGTLTSADAEDLYDFAAALFERLFTLPERTKAAAVRRAERRAAAARG